MKLVTLPYRTAIFTALDGEIVKSATEIPVYEEFVNETTDRRIANVPVGSETVKCYIMLLNQTSNEDSSKCVRNDRVSIQVQVFTEWYSGKGGSKLSEEIANLVIAKLFDADGLFNILELGDGLKLWKGSLEGSTNLSYDTKSSRVWITQLLITGEITQN